MKKGVKRRSSYDKSSVSSHQDFARRIIDLDNARQKLHSYKDEIDKRYSDTVSEYIKKKLLTIEDKENRIKKIQADLKEQALQVIKSQKELKEKEADIEEKLEHLTKGQIALGVDLNVKKSIVGRLQEDLAQYEERLRKEQEMLAKELKDIYQRRSELSKKDKNYEQKMQSLQEVLKLEEHFNSLKDHFVDQQKALHGLHRNMKNVHVNGIAELRKQLLEHEKALEEHEKKILNPSDIKKLQKERATFLRSVTAVGNRESKVEDVKKNKRIKHVLEILNELLNLLADDVIKDFAKKPEMKEVQWLFKEFGVG